MDKKSTKIELHPEQELLGMIGEYTAVIVDRIYPDEPKIIVRDVERPNSGDWEFSRDSALNFVKVVMSAVLDKKV